MGRGTDGLSRCQPWCGGDFQMNLSTLGPSLTDCPSAEQLRAFSTAALAAESMDAIELHVTQCDRCLTSLEACDQDSDELIQALAALPSGPDDEPAFQSLQASLLSAGESGSPADRPTATYPHPRATRIGPEGWPDELGGYQLQALIGQGGTGAVFRARHLKLDRIVAIKVLNARYMGHAPRAIERFQQEMRAVGRLDHPHIVRATDAGEDAGHHFLVMEYVEGIDASRLLRLVGPLRLADACEIVRQAALALQFAHQHNMVHRDVKPSNLLFSFDGQIKLLDLGLARHDSSAPELGADAQSNTPHGTADYMSPEQWTNFAAVDARADIYSLGCTLYKLLAGKSVYGGVRSDYRVTMQAHLSAPIPSIRRQRPEVPLGLQKILGRMLAKRPDERYASAEEVARRLEPYAQGARLAELGARLAASSPDELQQALAESAASEAPSVVERVRWSRRWMLASAAAVPLAAILWRIWPAKAPQLQLGQWRALQPAAPPREFPPAGAPATAPPAATAHLQPGQPLRIAAHQDALFELGQPVQGRFAVRLRFTFDRQFERLGLFFKYRPTKQKTTLAHSFQVIELAPGESGRPLLLWSYYCYYQEPSGGYRCEYEQWAETPLVLPAVSEAARLEVALGRSGFPEVTWNGQLLSEARWTLSTDARSMSQLTHDELQRAYLGRLGIFARSARASFSQLQLSYFDIPEVQ
jgi:serine/threonine protein kinase